MSDAQKRMIAQKTKGIVSALRQSEGHSQPPAPRTTRTSSTGSHSERGYPANWDDHGGGL
jgi:hypothetical protein